VLLTIPVSATPTASPRCPAPHPAADDWAPVAPRPTCQPRRPASRRPCRSKLSRGNAPPAHATVGPLRRRCHAVVLLHTVPGPPLSLSLSRSASTRCPPLRPPSPSLPLKTKPPPAEFSPPAHDFSFSALTLCHSHLPRLHLGPQDRPAAHRSPLFPDAPPSSRRATTRVSPSSTPPARRHLWTPPVLTGNTLPPASPHRATGERATARADRTR
jgi:hypothetical protein